jgi:superfamily II DNA or RNA helicase
MQKIANPTIELRLYQETDIVNIEKAWLENRSVLYQLPTGGGKSVVISKIVSDYKEEQIIIFAHKKRLLTQLYLRLKSLKLDVGLLFGQRSENLNAKILIVSIRTAVNEKRLDPLLKRKWDRVIIDEARHSRTASYDKVLDALLEKYPTHKLLGVDATPYRKDGKRLDKHFQYLVCSSETTLSLIEKGYLSSYRTFASPINLDELKEEVKEAGGDYQSLALSTYMRQDKYLQYVVNTYKEKGDGRQAIVFAVDKAHARDLAKKFIESGYDKIAQIDSDMDQAEIDQAFADYESKKIQLLINVEMITEGVDLPDTGCIVGARPTKSLTLYLQIVGRGTRLKSDGSDLIILDCCGWTQEYGVLSSPKHWSLNPEIDPNNPRTKNKVVGKRKDGSYTEELDEFTGELVEMTPEEYVQHLSGGLEQAESVNLSIDNKIANLFSMLIELLSKLLKAQNDFVYKSEVRDVKKGITQLVFVLSKYKDDFDKAKVSITIDIVKDKPIFARISSRYYGVDYNSSEEDVNEYRRVSRVVGEINKSLLEDDANKINNKTQGLLEQIIDLEKTKINLEDFRAQANQFKEEQWRKKVSEYIAREGEILLNSPTGESINKFFDRDYGRFKGIVFPKKKINTYMNTLGFTGCSEKNYIKGEKVWDILDRLQDQFAEESLRK